MIMRPLILIPASLLLAAGAGAQNLPYPRADDTAAMSTVKVTAPPRTVRIQSDEVRTIVGTYEMSNGWYLAVQTGQRHIDATIDNEKPMRLYAVAPYKFSSSDGNVKMEFNRGPWGDDMLMSYVPDPRVAQVIVLTSEVAQR
jgi:hypothetical protein